MTPAEQHTAVLEAAARQYYAAVYQHCHDSLEALGSAGRRRILERHAPEMVNRHGTITPVPQCETCAGMCHSRSGLACDEPVDGLWPCDEYRDAAAGLGVDLPA